MVESSDPPADDDDSEVSFIVTKSCVALLASCGNILSSDHDKGFTSLVIEYCNMYEKV